MKWLTNEELEKLKGGNSAAAQPEIAVADLHSETNDHMQPRCVHGDMQCIINRHKTASALHNILLVLVILLVLKWLTA